MASSKVAPLCRENQSYIRTLLEAKRRDLTIIQQLHTSARRDIPQTHEAIKHATSGPKDFMEIPNSHKNALLGFINIMRHRHDGHVLIKELHNMHGPIFRFKIGPFNSVFVQDANALEQYMRQEGKNPDRLTMESWLVHWKDLGQEYGLLLR